MATTKKTPTKKAPGRPAKKTAVQIEDAIPTKPEPVKPEETVSYVIPRDPSLSSGDQFFEWCLNGINYRFKRGEVLTHPRSLYDAISQKLRDREKVSPFIAEFQNTSKKLMN
ncbi:MAG: hypothetical protein IKV48_05930 [Eggerthellaceae bacterium]|nr:hypothetical protein [Eggerthellaceae bacterium]